MSDSDYDVEEYIIPDTVRRTYNNEDTLSDHEEANDSESAESEEDENEVSEEQKNPKEIPQNEPSTTEIQSNGAATERKKQEEMRTNNRYILYVTNLSPTTTREMLEEFFFDAGAVRSIRIPKVRLGNFAFVEMKDFEGFKAGLKYKEKELDGRKIQVYEGSKNKKHTSTKSRNLKRKTQQQHLSNIKLKNKTKNE